MPRTIYIIRHAERMDNVDKNWKKKVAPDFKTDNSPLSQQGYNQCAELAEWFKDIEVEHIFASPFDRTLDTATRMIGNRKFEIKAEAGFLEALYLCCTPPGIRPWNILKETYPLIDENYVPVINPWKEGFKPEGVGDDECTDRIKETIEAILDKYEGAIELINRTSWQSNEKLIMKKPGDIAIISHGSPIAALLEVLTGKWSYVGQATVSKLIEKKNGKFEALTIADHAHLSDKKNLRAW